MSDGYSPFTGRHQQLPMPVLIETCWRLIGKSNRPIRCATYQVATGVELWIGYEDDEYAPLRTQLFKPHEQAAIPEIAAAWRAAFDVSKFRQLTIESQK